MFGWAIAIAIVSASVAVLILGMVPEAAIILAKCMFFVPIVLLGFSLTWTRAKTQ